MSETMEVPVEVKVRRRGKGGAKKLAQSEAMLKANMAKRAAAPVVVTGVTMAKSITMIPPPQFGRLNVDERYQRVRIGEEVNQLIHVISSGGVIPDPIDVAEREDGSWWIVDGQQRYWAHDETKTPMRAMIHKVSTFESEKLLFVVLNSKRRVSPRTIAKGWPGPTGDFIRNLNENPNSNMCGMINFGNSRHLPIEAPALIKGILIAITGLESVEGDFTTMVLPRTDKALKVTGRMAWAEAYCNMVNLVFAVEKRAGNVRVLPLKALAYVCYDKYSKAGRTVFPKTTAYMRKINWDTIVPSHAKQYLPILVEAIQKRWK